MTITLQLYLNIWHLYILTDFYTTTLTISTSLVLYLYMDVQKIKWMNERNTTLSYLLTNLLTARSRVLLEKLTGSQLVKKLPPVYGTRRFITALTNARHLSLSWARSIQSLSPNPTSWSSILILSSHLRLGLPSGLFPSRFPTKTLYMPLLSPIRATCHTHPILLDFMTRIILGEEYKSFSSSLCSYVVLQNFIFIVKIATYFCCTYVASIRLDIELQLQLIGTIKRTIFKKVRRETILKIYNTLVLPTLLYGSENWALNNLTKTKNWSGRNELTETSVRLHPLRPQNKWLHMPRTTDYRHTRQDRWILTELAFTLAKSATKPNPFEIIPLQTTRKENNWKTEEASARAAVTVNTERIKESNPWCLWWWYVTVN